MGDRVRLEEYFYAIVHAQRLSGGKSDGSGRGATRYVGLLESTRTQILLIPPERLAWSKTTAHNHPHLLSSRRVLRSSNQPLSTGPSMTSQSC